MKFIKKHWLILALIFAGVFILYSIYRLVTGAVSDITGAITSPFKAISNGISAVWNDITGAFGGSSDTPMIANDPNNPIQTTAQAETFLNNNPQSDFNSTLGFVPFS